MTLTNIKSTDFFKKTDILTCDFRIENMVYFFFILKRNKVSSSIFLIKKIQCIWDIRITSYTKFRETTKQIIQFGYLNFSHTFRGFVKTVLKQKLVIFLLPQQLRHIISFYRFFLSKLEINRFKPLKYNHAPFLPLHDIRAPVNCFCISFCYFIFLFQWVSTYFEFL